MSTQQQMINHLQAALAAEMTLVVALGNLSTPRADALRVEIKQLEAAQEAAQEAASKREEMRLLNLKVAKCCNIVGCLTLLLCSWGVLRSWGVHQLAQHRGDNPTVVDISK